MSEKKLRYYDWVLDYVALANDVVPRLDKLKADLGGASDGDVARELLGMGSGGIFTIMRSVHRYGRKRDVKNGRDLLSISSLLAVCNLFDLDVRRYFVLDVYNARDYRV